MALLLAFPQGQLPPVKYLWSITVYSIPHACSWRIRSIGSSTPGLKTNEDGSLTIQAEAAFRTGKSDLWLRPVLHQKTERVRSPPLGLL